MQKAVRVRVQCLERVISSLKRVKGGEERTLWNLAEERECLKKWNALAYIARIDMETVPILDGISQAYMSKLHDYSKRLKENVVGTKVQLDTDLELLETIQLLLKYAYLYLRVGLNMWMRSCHFWNFGSVCIVSWRLAEK